MPVEVELSQAEDINQEDDDVPLLSKFQLWADAACLVQTDVVASMQILSANDMQTLNRKYRGKDKPTNVLSFPMELPEQVDINLLGDLAFCPDIINAEAVDQNKLQESHWAHMVIHGMLHLQGYDHIDSDDAVKMESLEITILKKLGIENPYEIN